MMASYLQETSTGQIIRFLTRKRVFRYPEEDPNFKIPWEQVQVTEKEAEIEAQAPATNGQSSSSDSSPRQTPAADEKLDPISQRNQPSERGLSTIQTQSSSVAARDFGLVTTRTKTREQTAQYTTERFDIEQQEAIERKQSSVIAPQKTADGITLVDWYTTDDPANPQNWNSWYKAFVTLQIFLYTFGVYAASAIYAPAEGDVMKKFGVGQSKASLGLSMYVIGYGVGPLVRHSNSLDL